MFIYRKVYGKKNGERGPAQGQGQESVISPPSGPVSNYLPTAASVAGVSPHAALGTLTGAGPSTSSHSRPHAAPQGHGQQQHTHAHAHAQGSGQQQSFSSPLASPSHEGSFAAAQSQQQAFAHDSAQNGHAGGGGQAAGSCIPPLHPEFLDSAFYRSFHTQRAYFFPSRS